MFFCPVFLNVMCNGCQLCQLCLFTVLAQRGYLKEQTFVNYLKYLQYWREPEYARYLKYPMCLHFLELLQHEAFRRECVSAQVSTNCTY